MHSFEVAKSEDCSITWWDLSCLSPSKTVRKEVNIYFGGFIHYTIRTTTEVLLFVGGGSNGFILVWTKWRQVVHANCILCKLCSLSYIGLFCSLSLFELNVWTDLLHQERAKELCSGNVGDGVVLSTMTICRVGRYTGRLAACRQVWVYVTANVYI